MANDSAGLSQLRTSTELKTHRILIMSLTFYDLCRLFRTLYREGPAIFPVQKHGLIAACFAGLRRGWLCRLFIIRTQNNVALIHKPAIFTDHIGVITDGIATGRLAGSGITIRQGRRSALTGGKSASKCNPQKSCASRKRLKSLIFRACAKFSLLPETVFAW